MKSHKNNTTAKHNDDDDKINTNKKPKHAELVMYFIDLYSVFQ